MFCWSKSSNRRKKSVSSPKSSGSTPKLKVSLVNGGSFNCDFDLLTGSGGHDDNSPLFRRSEKHRNSQKPSTAKSELFLLKDYSHGDEFEDSDESFELNYRSLWGKDLREFDFGDKKRAQSCSILSVGVVQEEDPNPKESEEKHGHVHVEDLLPTPPPTPPQEEDETDVSPPFDLLCVPKNLAFDFGQVSTLLQHDDVHADVSDTFCPEQDLSISKNPNNPVSHRLQQLSMNLATNKSEINELISCLRNAGAGSPTKVATATTQTEIQREQYPIVDHVQDAKKKVTLDKSTMTLTRPTTPAQIEQTQIHPHNPGSRYPSWIGVGIPVSTDDRDRDLGHHPCLRRWDEEELLDYSPGTSSLGSGSGGSVSSSGDSSLVLINNLKNRLNLNLNLSWAPGRGDLSGIGSGGSDGSGSAVSNYESFESYQQDIDEHRLQDHNRIPTSTLQHHNLTSKSKEVQPASLPNTRSRRRDEKDKESPVGDKESSPTLREQLSRLKIQLESLQTEDVLNKKEIQRLSTFTNQSLEERTRLVAELVQCSKKVEAMAVIVRHMDEKNTHLNTTIDDKIRRARQLDVLLKAAEDKSKQVPVLSGQLSSVHAIHRGELRQLKQGHTDKVQKLVECHNKDLDASRESLITSYDGKLAEKDKELEDLKETHRLEMESLLATRLNASPHDVLLKDIASMTAVIEMQNQRMKELQTRVQILSLKEEELVKSENLGRTLSARVEDLEAQINSNKYDKTSLLAQLAESEIALADAMTKNKSLVQSVDELTFKLNHPDIVPASPSACNFKDPNT